MHSRPTGKEVKVKLDNCIKEVGKTRLCLCAVYRWRIVVYAEGCDLVTEIRQDDKTIMLTQDRDKNGEVVWVLNKLRKTFRKLYFQKKFNVWQITLTLNDSWPCTDDDSLPEIYKQVHIQIRNFIINSVACYMFRPSVVTIFRELFVEVYIT